MKSKILVIAFVLIIVAAALIFYFNVFPQKISEIKAEENIGKKVSVYGEVKTVIKIGELSGYTLEDDSGTIAVSSDNLPKEGEKIAVRGTLLKDSLFGYYIKKTN